MLAKSANEGTSAHYLNPVQMGSSLGGYSSTMGGTFKRVSPTSAISKNTAVSSNCE